MHMPNGTMFAGLQGKLTLHSWRNFGATESDAYSLFHSRSVAMGWLTQAAKGATGGLWGMNDAGQQGPDPNAQHPYAVWFQVSLPRLISPAQPLPLQPFLSCVGDVVARMGTLHLSAIQVLLPIQSIDGFVDTSLSDEGLFAPLRSAGWFFDCNPHSITRVQVVLDGGENPIIRLVASDLFQWLQKIKQSVFTCDTFSLTDDTNVVKSTFIDDLWVGPPQHPVTFYGTLVEWSLDALGWLATFLAGISFKFGVTTPMLLTVSRFEG
ncbi:MAG: hypothetical protein KC410_07700 [Anaerolineales bacterium]|uniref:hypothetical protein n=1 Tax=Promineifilum sp. TaxID=2664178 RepID=UPI001D855C67|nr:hypothetical protein [Anaerolineales bacterium]